VTGSREDTEGERSTRREVINCQNDKKRPETGIETKKGGKPARGGEKRM